jgi:hypothetical protein
MFGSPETRSTGSPEMMQCLTTVSEKSTARALMASPYVCRVVVYVW